MDSRQLVQQLVESFTALADEVQNLTDRKTILEHKLRYAHEQYQALADKYAPCAPDVADTIAKLQLPPTPTSTNFVPLPSRLHSDSSQAQLALFIREGKKVAQQLSSLTHVIPSSDMNSDPSTVLEKDFTVEGRKGQLQCPFSATKENDVQGHDDGAQHHIPHPAGDPICAAMLEDTTSATTTNGAAQCPIRFMDKHSPEEIARYVETHKHELPRSHEVCLRRNQKTEEQIRKLDAKYGNLVSMIEDLSHLHAPMLPDAEQDQEGHVEPEPDRRVSDWAQNVSATVAEGIAPEEDAGHDETTLGDPDPDRNGRFDRPLKEVRVGESPSRPWGISVPYPPDEPLARPASPAAPVRMPSDSQAQPSEPEAAKPSKCPFDHTKMRLGGQTPAPAVPPHATDRETPVGPAKCPFDFTKMRLDGPGLAEFPKMEVEDQSPPRPATTSQAADQPHPPALKQPQPAPLDSPPASHQPAFLNMPAATTKAGTTGMTVPQMVFNGPVFIGYPMEQAIQFVQQFQNQQQPR
ncbi:hypothetical protein N0V93_001188 [Gnomoniopsis smithogilvyi]|uniref:Uncharacterized protein n=1 Tax=Gnomoniopsis smithogilvyi TaxID=1191159 RepID=A0A9W9D2E0_9PEZI|nr:hypothetical protein N0V93_001188 [Gnomoniopsis smithogilvyi]